MHQESGPYIIREIRDFVPERLKFWILILFCVIFQLSGGVYLAAVSEMVGSTALMQEDIMMAGYASMVGLALTFTLMFRLKFRFAIKPSMLTCAAVLIVCNLICMHTRSIPVLVSVCFVAGFFRMWGTFCCNTVLQLKVTPTRDMSVWFCYIYFIVQSCIQFSGLATIYTSFLASWEYMHWLVVALLGILMLGVVVMFRSYRSMPKLPLYGIDWLGGVMWALTVLCALFVCVYGEHYDWYQSDYIWIATIMGIVVLALNLWRASFIRHPFIMLGTWRFKVVFLPFLAYFAIDFLLAPSHLFEHIYMEAVLGYDSLNLISLDWIVLLGIAAGAFFAYQTFALRKWSFKLMTAIGFSGILAYLMIFYFTIDYNLPKESLMLPIFFRSFGYEIIAICFITAMARIPWPNFAQSLTVQAFASACLGGALGTAILNHLFIGATHKNAMLIGSSMDNVNTLASRFSGGELYGFVQRQAVMVSMKELYGWLSLLGIACMLVFLLRQSSFGRSFTKHPKNKTIRKFMKHEIKVFERLTKLRITKS